MRKKGGLIPSKFKFDKWTKTKPLSSISNEIYNKIKLISINKDNFIPFGSWTYKSQLYPGDVDLMEASEKCCDRDTAVKYFVKEIQKIVKNVLNERLIYLGDVKAGIDKRFNIDIGNIIYDSNIKIIGYNPNNIKSHLNQLYQSSLLNQDEYKYALDLIQNNISVIDYEKLSDFLRSKWLLRWNATELLNGYKILIGNKKYSLADAIQDNTMTKIDIWGNINNRFVEITNVYMLYYVNKEGERVLLNFENDLSLMIQKLHEEAMKFLYSPTYFNPFKMVKRIWSISRITKRYDIIKILTPFMQSDLGRLSQLKSEIETIISILENVKSPPKKTIYEQIDNFRTRFANIYQIDFDEEALDNIIISIVENKNTEYSIENLKYVLKYIKGLINSHTMEFLENSPQLF